MYPKVENLVKYRGIAAVFRPAVGHHTTSRATFGEEEYMMGTLSHGKLGPDRRSAVGTT